MTENQESKIHFTGGLALLLPPPPPFFSLSVVYSINAGVGRNFFFFVLTSAVLVFQHLLFRAATVSWAASRASSVSASSSAGIPLFSVFCFLVVSE